MKRCHRCGEPSVGYHCAKHAAEHVRTELRRQAKLVRAGLCARCRCPRGANATMRLCRTCADKQSANNLARYYRNKEAR